MDGGPEVGYQPRKISEISRVTIAIGILPRRRRLKKSDPSTSQSNNFGVNRKRFKPWTPGFNSHDKPMNIYERLACIRCIGHACVDLQRFLQKL